MKKYTVTEVSEILRKCPNSYLWLKSRDIWDELDYKNLAKIESGEKVISRIEPRKYVHLNETKFKKKVRATKDGISEIFDSYRKFAKDPRIKVSECWVSNSIKRGMKVRGYILEVQKEDGTFHRPFIPEPKLKKEKPETTPRKSTIIVCNGELTKEFESLASFASYIGVNSSSISKAISKGTKVKGYTVKKSDKEKGIKQPPVPILVKKYGYPQTFPSMASFAKSVGVLESSVSNAISRGTKIKGFTLQKI